MTDLTRIPASGISQTLITQIEQGGGPKIANVQIANSSWSVLDDTAVDTGGGYLIVNGSGFVTGCSVIIGTTTAAAVTFANSSQLRVTVAAANAATYPVYVVNPDGGTATKINGLTYSALPAWVTSSTLTTAITDAEYSYQLEATDATSYSLDAGSLLPANATLAANGLLVGTTTVESNTNYSFTVTATDAQNQESSRTFSLTISAVLRPPVTDYIALYLGDEYTGNTTWLDSSGNGYHVTIGGSGYQAVTATGSGATQPVSAFSGTSSTTALWPTQILPSTYTLFHVSKTRAGARFRVLNGYNSNWLSGHWSGLSGVAFHGAWGTINSSIDVHGTNWLYATDQKELFRSNGVTRGTISGGTSNRLCINTAGGGTNEAGNFDIAEVIVYDRELNSTEYQAVEAYLASKYGIS